MANLKVWLEKISKTYPRGKKVVGVVLIIIGLAALVTPLTPGSWLAIVGLELLGIRLVAWEKIKTWLSKQK